MPDDMPNDREPPAAPPTDLPEAEVYRELMEQVREVSRGIVERVNKVLPDDPDKPLPPSPPDSPIEDPR
jgi:hypothetical protein